MASGIGSDAHAVTIVKALADLLSEKHDWKTFLAIDLIAEMQKRINNELGTG